MRVLVWTGVVLMAMAVGATVLNSGPEPTVYSIKDEHEDCGSGGENYAALESCLTERYGWPALVAERFGDAMRDRHEREAAIERPTDWDAFRSHAADLRAVYHALGARDIGDVELDIYADSATAAFSDSIRQIIRDSVDRVERTRMRRT